MAAYIIFTHRVTDADRLNNDYLPKAVETLGPYAPEILVVDENVEVIEGDSGHTRCVVLKFKDRDEVKKWYQSPEYQAIVADIARDVHAMRERILEAEETGDWEPLRSLAIERARSQLSSASP